MSFYQQLSDGESVMITRKGADEYRTGKMVQGFALGAVLGAPALMIAAPGAILGGIGIAAAGMGIGVPAAGIGAAGAAVGGGAGGILANLFPSPEANDKGVIVDKKQNFGEDGFDYKVKWDLNGQTSWHPRRHLIKIDNSKSREE